MERKKVGAMEKTTASSSSSSSDVKVKVEPQMERKAVFNLQVGQPGLTHIWNDAQLPFSGPVPGLPQHKICGFEQPWDTCIWNDDLPCTGGVSCLPRLNICKFEQPWDTHIWNDDLPHTGRVPGLPQHNICKFEQPWDTRIWNDDLPRTGPVPGRPEHNFYQHDNISEEVQRQMHLDRQRMHQVPSQQLRQQFAQLQPCVIPKHTFEAPQFLGSTGQVLRRHLDSHAPKQPGAATPSAPNEAHSDDGVISRKHSQERFSQVGELAAGIATNKMRSTHSAEALVQLGGVPGMQQEGFSQILEQFNTKFEERMTKFEERMTKFEGLAVVPQLVDRISELEKNLENLAGIILKDTGNTTTVVEEKLTNLTVSDIKSKEGSTSEEEGYTCGEDFVHLSEE